MFLPVLGRLDKRLCRQLSGRFVVGCGLTVNQGWLSYSLAINKTAILPNILTNALIIYTTFVQIVGLASLV